MPNRLTRRTFLKIAGAGLLAAVGSPRAAAARERAIFLGWITNRQYTFDRPTEESNRLVKPLADDVVNVYEAMTMPDQLPYDRNWFRTDGGYINAATVQPVLSRSNRPVSQILPSGQLGEITVPYADARWYPERDAPVAYRLYYSTTYWTKGHVAVGGDAWYKVWDDLLKDYYYAPASAVRLIPAGEIAPLSPGVTQKRIEVNLTRQTVEAFEGDRSVFKAPTSTGRMFPRADGGWDDFRTPTGELAIQRKRPSRHTLAPRLRAAQVQVWLRAIWSPATDTTCPECPGCRTFCGGGYRFTGRRRWHNDFGRVHSHGCIRLRRAARGCQVDLPLVAPGGGLRPGVRDRDGHRGYFVCGRVTHAWPNLPARGGWRLLAQGENPMPRVIVFDVNETLLDLRALDPHFQHVFGDAAVRGQWFAQVLQSALVATVTQTYSDFSAIGRAALEMTEARRGVILAEADRAQILGAMRALPPHPEVVESLERLRDAGLRLATLTNSTQPVAKAQLTHAGLIGFFEQVLSVDSVHRFKPAAEVYHMAAHSLGVEPAGMRLVAAHIWDVTGAMRAGCAAAFITRPGMVLDPLAEAPDVVGPDLRVVAERMIEVEQ